MTVGSTPTRTEPAALAASPPRRRWRRLVLVGALVVVLIAGVAYGYALVRTALTTVSTDDAYVNSHVTYVAPRIAETVASVLVDDNDFVRKGDLLVVLDRDVERVRVEQAEAALRIARRAAEQALAEARATAAQAKADHFKLVSAMTEVRNMVASLRRAVARLDEARAAERLARIEAARFAE